ASKRFIAHTTTMNAPIVNHRNAFNGVVRLKWLVVPRAACLRITAISTMKLTTVTLAAKRARRGQVFTNPSSQTKVKQYRLTDTANLAGFSQAGAPVMMR